MARGVNKVILIGNLGADPETRYMPNGNAVSNLNLATDESYKDKQTGQMVPRTEWHRVVIFGKVAEVAAQYLRKGSKVYIEGRLQTRKWQDQSGQDKFTTEIVVDIAGQMQMLDSRGSDGGQSMGTQQGGGQQQGQQNQGGGQQGQQNQGGGQRQPAPARPQDNAQNNQGGGYAPQQGKNNAMPEPVDDFDDDIPF